MHIPRHTYTDRQAFRCPNGKSRHKNIEYVNIVLMECAIGSALSLYVQLILEASTEGSTPFVFEFKV